MKYFIVKCNDLEFKASVFSPQKVSSKDEQSYMIEFGGKRKCIDITVYKNESDAWISGLRHRYDCAYNKRLPKGDAGTIIMIKTALGFTKIMFSFVRHFKFCDDSFIKLTMNYRISLAPYYVTKYKKTWYEMKFEAYLENEDEAKKLDSINTMLDSKKHKNKYVSYRNFYDKHILLLRNKIFDRTFEALQPSKELEKHFKECTTIRKFLLLLDETHEIIIFDTWLERLIGLELMDLIWIIDCEKTVVPRIDNIKISKDVKNTPFAPSNKHKIEINSIMNTKQRGGLFLDIV